MSGPWPDLGLFCLGVPRDHWRLDEEKRAIIEFHDKFRSTPRSDVRART